MKTRNNKILLKLSLAFFSLSLFIGRHILDYATVLLIISLISDAIRSKKISFNKNKSLFIIITFYLLHIIGLFYSNNKDIAGFDLQVKASLLIFPLIFLFRKDFDKEIKILILRIFSLSSVLISLLLIIRAVINYTQSENPADLIYSNFSVLLHPSYYAMYLIFSLVINIYFIKEKICKTKIIPFISLIITVITIFMCDSKSGLVSLFVIISYILISYLYKKSKIITFSSLIAIIVLLIITINTNQRMKIMFKVVRNYKQTIENPKTYKESTGLRILSWNATIKLIKQNLVFGVGTGDIKPELFKKYNELDYQKNIERQMNVHFQFLETWLGQGILGFVFLIALFILPFCDAVKKQDFILQSFLLLMFVNFMFESMLNTQAGTIFFGFFYSLLVFDNKMHK